MEQWGMLLCCLKLWMGNKTTPANLTTGLGFSGEYEVETYTINRVLEDQAKKLI